MMIYLLVFKKTFFHSYVKQPEGICSANIWKDGEELCWSKNCLRVVKPMKYSEGKWITRLVVAPFPVYSLGKWGFQKQHMLI
jgi:hypothetical protein